MKNGMDIPDDWNGETWRGVCIQWPDSVKWRGLLLGQLSLWRRGRIWDARTGCIVDVQAIGNAIWETNWDLPPCSGGGYMMYGACGKAANRMLGDGGTATADDTWHIVDFNHLDDDAEGRVGLLVPGSIISVQAGTWRVRARTAFMATNNAQTRLIYQETGQVVKDVNGEDCISIPTWHDGVADVGWATSPSEMDCVIELSVAHTFWVQYRVGRTQTGFGLGYRGVDPAEETTHATIEFCEVVRSTPGPIGPTGPQGIQGVQGEQGLPGEFDCEELRDCLSDLLNPGDEPESYAKWPGGDPVDLSAACRIAEGCLRAVTQLRDDIEEELVDPLANVAGLCAIAAGIFMLVAAPPLGILILGSMAAIAGMTLTSFRDTFTDEAMGRFKCIVYCAIIENGTLNNAALVQITNAVHDEFDDSLLEEFFDMFVDSTGKSGMSNTVALYQIEVWDCSECTCAPPAWLVVDASMSSPDASVTDVGSGWWEFNTGILPKQGEPWSGEMVCRAVRSDGLCWRPIDAELIAGNDTDMIREFCGGGWEPRNGVNSFLGGFTCIEGAIGKAGAQLIWRFQVEACTA